MNCKIVVVIIVVLCIGDAIAKKHNPKFHLSPKSHSSSDSSSSSGSNQKGAKSCDDAPFFKKQEHCEHCCTDECKTCESREKSGSDRQFKWQCQAVMCSILEAPDNGFISNDNRTCGSQVTYSCETGYQLSGSENRNCQPDGTWSDIAPVCEVAVMCDVPEPPHMTHGPGGPQGTVTWSGLQVGATADYQCPTGYRRDGPQTRTCQQDGLWSESTPWCLMMTNTPT